MYNKEFTKEDIAKFLDKIEKPERMPIMYRGCVNVKGPVEATFSCGDPDCKPCSSFHEIFTNELKKLYINMDPFKNPTSFGEAIKALKEGKRVAREGWNGKGLFIFMQVPADINVEQVVPNMQSLPQSVKDEFMRRLKPIQDRVKSTFDKHPEMEEYVYDDSETPFLKIKYRNQLAMVYPDNTIYGWVASPSDVLEEDWIILD